MYPELWRDDVCEDPGAAAESDAYERGRWEAIKEAARWLRATPVLDIIEGAGKESDGPRDIFARAILAHEAQLKKQREARRGSQ